MKAKVKPIPKGFHTITPALVVSDGVRAIEFYKKAFGAQEIYRIEGSQGKILHAELKIGDSMMMVADEMWGGGCRSPLLLDGTPINLFLYFEDIDRVFNQAIAASAKVEMPVEDMFWGDRHGKVTDPFGHSWSMATHKEDVSPKELRKRAEAFIAKMGR
jgi:PhnB protein